MVAPQPQPPSSKKASTGRLTKGSIGGRADAEGITNFIPPAKYTREERKFNFGVDCQDKVTWKSWKPGGEYTAVLDIANCRPKLQVIQYNLPQQKATFFLEYPQPITLSTGMKYQLKIKFRPTKLIQFRDWIEIVTDQGSFFVELEALIPYTSMEHPPKHDFGYCPVKEASTHTFPMKNTGNVPFDFVWSVPMGKAGEQPPFTVAPSAGRLAPGQQISITVQFIPQEACVFVAAAVCTFGPEKKTSVWKVSGIGKYSFVKSSLTNIDFGEVLIGKQGEKMLTLMNHSVVPARFRIKRGHSDAPDPFTFVPSGGTVPPEGSLPVKVVYKPVSCGLHSMIDFAVTTVSGNTVPLVCSGLGTGPELSLSIGHSGVHFGDVATGEVKEKVVMLTNSSPHPVAFQLMLTDPGCAFRCHPFRGEIGPRKTRNITITFAPREPVNYYRRVHVLAAGSIEPLWMDLLGTAYSGNTRPPPFTHRHILQWRARQSLGLGRLTPEEIDDMMDRIKKNDPPVDQDEEAARGAFIAAMSPPPPSAKAALLEVSRDPTDGDGMAFSLEESQIDFGCVHPRNREAKQVTVRNHTSAKGTAYWHTDENSVFEVTPATQDVPPFGSAAFTIRVHPTAPGASYYMSTLECYVNFKTMRSFRLATDENITPPVCLHLPCLAHTFHTENHFPAKLSLSTTKVSFPAVHAGGRAFQTILLHNEGNTPCAFRVELGETTVVEHKSKHTPHEVQRENSLNSTIGMLTRQKTFSIFPMANVIPAGTCQVLLLQFFAPKAATYNVPVSIFSNYSNLNPLHLRLHSSSFLPSLVLSNDATVHIKATAVGVTASRSYTIHNPCNISVLYDFELPPRLSHLLRIDPAPNGVLKGNEKRVLKLSFTPDKVRRYMLKVPVTCTSEDPIGGEVKQRHVLTVLGEGTVGGLTLEPASLDFETTLVGKTAVQDIAIFNSTTCDTRYALGWVVDDDHTPEPEEDIAGDPEPPQEVLPPPFEHHTPTPEELTFSAPSGVIPARAHKTIHVSFKPTKRRPYKFKIFCRIIGEGKAAWSAHTNSTPTGEELAVLPSVLASGYGCYPVLQVADIRSTTISKGHLWQQMNVTRINEGLQLDIQESDLGCGDVDTALSRLTKIPMDFGAGVVGSLPTKVFVTFENVSRIPVAFDVIFPSDSEIPVERWFYEPPPDKRQLLQEMVIDNELFQVAPRRSAVPPGGKCTVQLLCKRKFPGRHSLPILLRIEDGRCTLLELVGETLKEDAVHLDIPSLSHSFAPVAIGDLEPPVQYFELRNSSHNPVKYELDPAPFERIQEENFDFPIFQCLNASGEIPPLSSVMLRWFFRPLQAMSYTIEVPIHVVGGGSYTVVFKGDGFHPKQVSQQQLREMAVAEFLPIKRVPAMETMPREFPIVLSQDVLHIGRVPAHSLHRRLLILRNVHPTDSYIFEWKTELQCGEQIIEMQPASGRVAAGDHVLCKLTMYTGSLCHIVEQSIQCHILNDDLRLRRQAVREKIEKQAALSLEPAEEEMSTVKSPQRTQGTGHSGTNVVFSPGTVRRPNKNPKRVPITQAPPKYQTTTQLYNTMKKLLEQEAAADDDDNDNMVWMDVVPSTISVPIQVRIQNFDSYRTANPEKWGRHFLPILAVYQQHIDPGVPEPPKMLKEVREALVGWKEEAVPLPPEFIEHPMEAAECLFAKDIVTGILQDILHDPDVRMTYQELDEVPVPYYQDFTSVPTASWSPPEVPEHCWEILQAADTESDRPSEEVYPVGAVVPILVGKEEVDVEVVGHSRGRVGVRYPSGDVKGLPIGRLKEVSKAEVAKQEALAKVKAHDAYLQETKDEWEREYEESCNREILQSGVFQCLAEEVLETLLFTILKDAVLDPDNQAKSLVPSRQNKMRVARMTSASSFAGSPAKDRA
eukprot:Sspe_Gene.18719::Locus_6766_Transcript_1_1_Confidence_1.000_Length_5890::g.18719::m.18719